MIFWSIPSALLAALAVGLAARWLPWPGDMTASVFPQLAAGALGVGVLLGVTGRARAGATCLLIGLALAWSAREQFAPPTAQTARTDARVVWANVFGRTEAFAEVMRLASEVEADVVVVAEYPHKLDGRERDALLGAFVHAAGGVAGAPTNVNLFSRTPILGAAVSDARVRRGLIATIRKGETELVVGAVHASLPFRPGAVADRAASVRGVLELIPADAPALVVGDLNAVPWTPLLRDIAGEGRARRVDLGWRATWLAPVPVFGLPIDHAFALGSARASARLGPWVGSDHLPLIVDVQLWPDESQDPT